MGQLVDGVWHERASYAGEDGRFVRQDSRFRNWITADGSPGPSGEGGFAAEPGRYHLYVSYACPWAHRTLIMRALKRLEAVVDVSVVHWYMGVNGWSFAADDGATGDRLGGLRYLYELYLQAAPRYTGRATVPVLWDRERETIVSNESAEIIRMLNASFDRWADNSVDFYPEPLRERIDEINARIYRNINNGVYRCGFATSQPAYEEAFDALFQEIDRVDARLGRNRYLLGDTLTEADWRLFTTLVRFDPVYFGHFKCNKRRLVDYANLWNYAKELYQTPGAAETVNFHHIKHHYYCSHRSINPTGVVPKGPEIDFAAGHDRGRLAAG